MGKPKKGKKGRQDDDFGDDTETVDPLVQPESIEDVEPAPKPVAGKKAKGKKKKKDDDWGDDVSSEIAALSLADQEVTNGGEEDIQPKSSRAKRKEKKKKQIENSDEDEDEDLTPVGGGKKGKGMSAFAMLAMEEASNSEEEEEEKEEEIDVPVPKKKGKDAKKQQSIEGDVSDNSELEPQPQQQKKKGKKEKKKKGGEDEQDIDAILADLDKPAEKQEGKKKKKKKGGDEEAEPQAESTKELSEPMEENENPELKYSEAMTAEDIAKMYEEQEKEEAERKLKKKEKKKKQSKKEEKEETAVEKEEDIEDEAKDDEDDTDSTVKTAAQKKKEKRERQKQQKLLEKQSGKKQAKPADAAVKETPAAEDEGDMESDKDGDDDDKKKKKKDRKKKKGEKEEEEKKKKPGNKQLRAMQEALQKLKEDEERLEREEEEKIRKLEEARKAKEESERLEKEKKEKEKQKKKERIERQKKEGTFKTKAQKEAEKRAKQLLEARGLDLPPKPALAEGEKKKRIVYDSRPRKKKLQQQNSREEMPVAVKTVEVQKEEPVIVKEEEVVLDSWEDVEEKEDQPDAGPVKPDVKEKVEKESEGEEESEEEEESEDESSEEEEEESSEDDSSDEDSSDDGLTSAERARERAEIRINKRLEQAKAKKSLDDLRSPVVCVLGHVDTGKTKILDKLRKTNVQDGEAGGITQQIGATNVPSDTIRTQTKMCKEFAKKELKLPGLLIIDTPGHESFSNLRTRGSSLCDIAVLVVDIMHGLEPQTIESINLLKMRKTPFVVALNKVDRLFQWQPNPHSDILNTLKKQKPNTKVEFDERVQQAVVQFAEQGLNVALSYENKNPREYISLCPTSAHSGDGMGNLIALICELSQSFLAERLAYINHLQATVMEVKALPGLGTTIDVILVNGHLKEGDTILVAGTEGPIVTTIRGLLMPQPLRELRVKGAYIHFKEIKAAQGVKIIARDLDKALAGLPLYVAERDDEVDYYKEDLDNSLQAILEGIKVQSEGVFVQASTLGSLEALLEFLRTSRIPYAGINIGPVHRRDIMKASVMLEHDSQYAVILAFDVKVEREAQEMSDNLGVKIFTADIIYHLFDAFTAFRDEVKRKNQEEYKSIAVFPCKLRILPQCIFNSRDPIVCGVVVEAGFVKEGTPICVPSKGFLEVGLVTSIELNHKAIDTARKGQEVCVKIESVPGEAPKLYGRHFDHTDILMSKISRQSIDAVKNYFREEMTKADWQLIMELKKLFEIL